MTALATIERPPPDETKSRLDFVSWSQLSTFRQCPLRYRFRYIDKVEPEFVASSLLLGSSIHSAIEHFHRSDLEGRETPTLDELLEEFWYEWKCRAEESPQIRFNKSEDPQSIHDTASRMLQAFLENKNSMVPGTIIGIEENLEERILKSDRPLLGIIDLIYESNDHIVVRDYKTSRSKWSQANAESSADQLLLYGELAMHLFPGTDVAFEFVVITKANKPSVERFEVKSDDRRVNRTKLVANKTLRAIQSGIFYPNKSPMTCSTCPYRSECAAWQG